MPGNANFDVIASTTLQNYRKTLEDNIFLAMPVLSVLDKFGRVDERGGDKIVEPLMYGKNDTVDWLEKYGIIETHAIDGISAAEFPWAHLGGAIVVSNIEIDLQNAGEEQVINLLAAKVKQAELSIKDKVYTQLWTARADTKRMWGLPDLCSGSAGAGYADPTSGSYGNISGTSNTWWKNVLKDVTGATTLTLTYLNNLYNQCADGTDEPDIIVMPQDIYEKYESLLMPSYRFSDDRLVNSGIEHLKHKNAVVVLDKNCTANTVYCLNSTYIQFVNAKGRRFAVGKFQEPVNQDVRVAKILWSGNLACSCRRKQGKMVAVTAT